MSAYMKGFLTSQYGGDTRVSSSTEHFIFSRYGMIVFLSHERLVFFRFLTQFMLVTFSSKRDHLVPFSAGENTETSLHTYGCLRTQSAARVHFSSG